MMIDPYNPNAFWKLILLPIALCALFVLIWGVTGNLKPEYQNDFDGKPEYQNDFDGLVRSSNDWSCSEVSGLWNRCISLCQGDRACVGSCSVEWKELKEERCKE